MRFIQAVSVAALIGFTVATAGQAQTSATISARALVRQPITFGTNRDLDFGVVLQGTPKTIAYTDATSGRFDATGTASANVNISFTLPANLTSGGNNLPIGTWTGCHNPTANSSGAGCTAIGSMAGTTAAAFGAGGNLWVFVGATVTPGAAQVVGLYTAPVQMTLTYF